MSDLPPESNRLDPEHHPTPFSAAQIRAASRPGTVVRFRMEPSDDDPYVDAWEFIDGDDERGRRRRWTEDLDGTVIEAPRETESGWIDLQHHASYPSSTTRLMTGVATTRSGDHDCWVYVTANDDGTITTAWFDRTEPGPPVLMESRREGELLFRMELISAERAS